MITVPFIRSRHQRFVSVLASVLLLVSIGSPVLAQDESGSESTVLQTIELQGTEQRTIAGENILNDVIVRDSSQLSLEQDPVTGALSSVDGNALGFNSARIFITHSRIAGNVNASEDSIIVLLQSAVDGNIEVNGNGIVAIGPQTVVSGDIEGVFLGTDVDGYAIYVGQ